MCPGAEARSLSAYQHCPKRHAAPRNRFMRRSGRATPQAAGPDDLDAIQELIVADRVPGQ